MHLALVAFEEVAELIECGLNGPWQHGSPFQEASTK